MVRALTSHFSPRRIVLVTLALTFAAAATPAASSSTRPLVLQVPFAAPASVELPAQTQSGDSRLQAQSGKPPKQRQRGDSSGAFTKVPVSMELRPTDPAARLRIVGEIDPQDPQKPRTQQPMAGTPGWTTILSEDAEGNFPADNGWIVNDSDPGSGYDYWDDVSCRFHGGARSVFSAGSGSMTDCFSYDNDMYSWMVYGPFSLADAAEARAEFYLWSLTELDSDWVYWLASVDGAMFYPWGGLSGYTDWTLIEADFKTHPSLGDITGLGNVWFGLLFVSNSVNTRIGVYVDDILIEKHVPSTDPDIRIEPLTLDFTAPGAGPASADLITAREATPEQLQDLRRKAVDSGGVRVIVGLDTPFVPEGRMADPAAAQTQRANIVRVQDSVLAALAGSTFTTIARYQFIPYMALEVDAQALDLLASLPETTTIQEDTPLPPTMASSIPIIGADDAWAAGFDGAGQTVAGVLLNNQRRLWLDQCLSWRRAGFDSARIRSQLRNLRHRLRPRYSHRGVGGGQRRIRARLRCGARRRSDPDSGVLAIRQRGELFLVGPSLSVRPGIYQRPDSGTRASVRIAEYVRHRSREYEHRGWPLLQRCRL